MPDITFACPHCSVKLEVDESGAGITVDCPQCKRPVVVPSKATPPCPPRLQQTGNGLTALAERAESQVSDVIRSFVTEQQDPAQVKEIHAKVAQILTKQERITYISVQDRPVVNVKPDAVVLTNRRFIVYHRKLLGRADFEDYIWRDLADVRLKEGLLRATITFQATNGRTVELDHLPKAQARRVYAIAQEMEERVREERRLREMEEKRAAAGGIVIQGAGAGLHAPGVASGEDPVQKLKQLKEMLDAGLITEGEYEAKRQAVLSRM